MRSTATYSLLLTIALFITGWSSVNAEIFKGFPDMIICKPGQGAEPIGELVFYVESRGKDGTTYL
jgi:hypothetical protein